MAVKLSVGLQKKVGLPNYGSLGASCHVEFEIDRVLIEHDLQGFHAKVREAFAACQQGVQDQLASQLADSHSDHVSPPVVGQNGNGQHTSGYFARNGNGHASGQREIVRPATASQVRAIRAIAARQRIDLYQLLGDRFQVTRPDDLSIADASDLIDELKGPSETNGGRG